MKKISAVSLLFLFIGAALSGESPVKSAEKSLKSNFPDEVVSTFHWKEGENEIRAIHDGPVVISLHKYKTSGGTTGILYTGRVFTCRATGCGGINTFSTETSGLESFDYFILLNEQLKIVEVKIFEYNALHGQAVTARSWLKQFIGRSPSDELRYGKEIDGASGATKSSKSAILDVNMVLDALNRIKE